MVCANMFACCGAQELPAETPSGLAYRMRSPGQDSAHSVTWEFSGGTPAMQGVPLSPASCMTPVDVEYRLQAVEDQQAAVLGELEALKGLGGQLSAWRGQMDAASARLAAVLDMAEAESAGFRQASCLPGSIAGKCLPSVRPTLTRSIALLVSWGLVSGSMECTAAACQGLAQADCRACAGRSWQ